MFETNDNACEPSVIEIIDMEDNNSNFISIKYGTYSYIVEFFIQSL